MDGASQLEHVAIVSETDNVPFRALCKVSAALQKQVMRDLAPFWNIRATVDAFGSLEDVPLDSWPIIIRDDIEMDGAQGVHLDKDGHPFGLVQFSEGWSLTTSHECLEMLVDPQGNNTRAGQSPKPGQGRVEFLVEVCDPSEADDFAYTVNGVMVSDFYTPEYFAPVAVPGARYSFTRAITQPRQVLKGGYLSWHDPISDHWFQQTFFSGAKPTFRDLGVFAQANGSIRTQIYAKTPEAFRARKPKTKMALFASKKSDEASEAGSAKAKTLRKQINALLKKK